MDIESHLVPPSWVTQPSKFDEALNHSLYYDSNMQSTVSVTEPDKFASGIRSFLYWRRQLAPSLTGFSVMFALIGATGILPLNVISVMTGALRAYCLLNAIEFSQGANSNFLAVSFKTIESATKFRETFRYFGEAVIAYVTPPASKSYRFSLLWLPPMFDISKVRGLLNKYSVHYTTVKGSMDLGGGNYMPSSVIRGSFDLKEGLTIDDLPHLIPLPAPHLGYALLIVEGRDPFCLRCLKCGHLRKHCPRPRCKLCRFYHLESEVCNATSYAVRVSRSPGATEHYCWMDDIAGPSDHLSASSGAAVASAVAAASVHVSTFVTVPPDKSPPLEPLPLCSTSTDDADENGSIISPTASLSLAGGEAVPISECGHSGDDESALSASMLLLPVSPQTSSVASFSELLGVSSIPQTLSCAVNSVELCTLTGDEELSNGASSDADSGGEAQSTELSEPDIDTKRCKVNDFVNAEPEEKPIPECPGRRYPQRKSDVLDVSSAPSPEKRKSRSKTSVSKVAASSKRKK